MRAFLKRAHTAYILPTGLKPIFKLYLKFKNAKYEVISPNTHSTATRTELSFRLYFSWEAFSGSPACRANVRHAWLDKGSYGIQFLPWYQEGYIDLIKVFAELVNEIVDFISIMHNTNRDTKVSIVLMLFQSRDDVALHHEIV